MTPIGGGSSWRREEGTGVVVLESLDSALGRGAAIYCEMAWYGATCDVHHITTPTPRGRGLAAAMEIAIAQGNMEKEDVNYVNAHGIARGRTGGSWSRAPRA